MGGSCRRHCLPESPRLPVLLLSRLPVLLSALLPVLLLARLPLSRLQLSRLLLTRLPALVSALLPARRPVLLLRLPSILLRARLFSRWTLRCHRCRPPLNIPWLRALNSQRKTLRRFVVTAEKHPNWSVVSRVPLGRQVAVGRQLGRQVALVE